MSKPELSNAHRGGLATQVPTIRPAQDLFERIGGRPVVERVVDGLYDRIAEDPFLESLFHGRARGRHQHQKFFFEEWMGGEPRYLREIGGLGSRVFHERFDIDRRSAGRWLRHMVSSLREQQVAEPLVKEVVNCLAPMAHAMGHMGPPLPESFRCADLSEKTARLAVDPELLHRHSGDGRRLLFEACASGDAQLVELLLDHGLSPDLPSAVDGLMLTPWCRAKAMGHGGVAAILESRGAVLDVFSAAYLGDLDLLTALIEVEPAFLDAEDPATDHAAVTPLHHAILGGQAKAAEWLLERGAGVGADGHRLLLKAACAGWQAVVEHLLSAGVEAARVPPDRWVLHSPIAERLLESGADINRPSSAWLHFCGAGSAYGDDPDLIEKLVSYGADLGARAGRRGPLHLAAGAGHLKILEVLLRRGLPVDDEDGDGETPLAHVSWAEAGADRLGTTRLLLAHGADPEHRSRRGMSPWDRIRRVKTPEGRERRRLMSEARERSR